ncbi:MAG: TonB-dependent receptor [Bacteroidetes bacterium]|nr:TonB-dependent receptor [Bacteroidota bacterium]
MKKLLTILIFTALAAVSFAQVTGTVLDQETGEGLIGATVMLKGTNLGTITDFDGSYSIDDVSDGTYTVMISFTGYETYEVEVNVSEGKADAGAINIGFTSVGLEQVNVVASVAIDRKTPVAVSTIKGAEIEAKVGNQEFTEILRSTPSVYVTKTGGGFGDSRINVRGFDQRNTAVMINGIPVNDMENGWVYWSNWAGLSDVTSTMQVQRGLGASKLAVASVGGSINIVTNAAEFRKGAKASISFGNDGYQKYGVMLSSGLQDNGFAATAQFTHTRGDGYVDRTMFRAYSYFLSVSQTFNDQHTLSLSAVGAPQWHHQRDQSRFDNISLDTYREQGIRFNHRAGTLDGEEFSWRKNFFHKPKVFLNHYWTINEKTNVKTSAYVSFGRGGGTGARGRANGADEDIFFRGRVFDSFSGFGLGTHNDDGSVNFDRIVAYNQGQSVPEFGEDNTEPGTTTSSGDGFIRRASMNYHNWYGVLSTLTHELSDNLTLVAGLDGRYYKGEHFRRLENLLGNTSYLSRSDDNNPENVISEVSTAEFGNFSDDSYKNGNNVLNYRNDGLVNWLGVFAQLEYSTDKMNLFATVSGSNQGFKRIDYFNYLDSDPERETDWQNFLGGTVKAGANFNLTETMNVFVNAGYFSRQPLFDNVFLNFRNDINDDLSNQSVTSFEAGYGLRTRQLRGNVNLYYTTWGNRQFDESFTAEDNQGNQVSALAVFRDVAETHAGVELDFAYTPIRSLTIKGMLSVGNWEYDGNFASTVTNLDNNNPLNIGENPTIYGDGLKVGDAAQTTAGLGINYEVINGLRAYADYYFYDNTYAAFNVFEDQFREPGAQVAKIPSYSLVDAGVSYKFDLNNIGITLRFNVNNLLDETYVAELLTNNTDDFYSNRGWFGFGRTWNTGIKFSF